MVSSESPTRKRCIPYGPYVAFQDALSPTPVKGARERRGGCTWPTCFGFAAVSQIQSAVAPLL
ncbi:MAG: hypothetical protein ACPIOQ_06015, partial [Promethearchaeia archaeon]